MSTFRQLPLFDVPVQALTEVPTKSKAAQKKDAERGCAFCPLNKVHGLKKIMGRIRGKKIAVFAQSPGPDENDEGIELIGPAGTWWWDEAARVGIDRRHCDIQNIGTRCLPADWKEGHHGRYLAMRNPTAKEIHCCSIFNERVNAELKADQILVLGKIAARALLRTRSLPEAKAFWSDELKAKVYLLDHPSFFIRGYGQGPRLAAFRALLDQVARDRRKFKKGSGGEVTDPYWFIKQQDYRTITEGRQARKAVKEIRRIAGKHRITVDVEDYGGVLHCVGVCPKPGLSYVFILRHADVPVKNTVGIRKALARLLADETVEKGFQFGCTDVEKLETAGMPVHGFTHDTYFSEFLRFSDLKAYGLDEITQRRFPKFGDYWTVVANEMLDGVEGVPPKIQHGTAAAKYKYIQDKKLFNISKLSLKTLTLYNGADCDVTKRVEISNSKKVPQALMQLYIDLGFLLRKMEANGPMFDYEQHQQLDMIYPVKAKALKSQLRKMLRKKTRWYKYHDTFNPGSPDQVLEALYNSKTGFGLEYPFEGDRKQGKPNTRKMTMLTLGREHKWPLLEVEWRAVSKVKSTYLDSYFQCAKENGDSLRTKWHGTGARTGRLSSGGEKKKKDVVTKLINLQNIKKDPQMQNLCIADRRWRRVYRTIGILLAKYAPGVVEYWRVCDRGERLALKSGTKWKAPDMTSEIKLQLERAGKRIEKWLRKHIPDFKTFAMADYGQIEIRTLAQLSGDRNLRKDCEESDIHSFVGAGMTGWDVEAIKHDEVIRTLTKNIHFGIAFGLAKDNMFSFVLAMTPPAVREGILARFRREQPDRDPIEVWEAQVGEAYDRYFKRYKGVRRFIENQREFASEHKYVETLFGMIQTLNVTDSYGGEGTEFVDPDEIGAGAAYWANQAVNGCVQGTAHQLMICALVNLIRKAVKYRILGIPPLEVHDALYFVVEVLQLQKAAKKIKYLLENESLKTVATDFPDIDWQVPIVVEMKGGVRLGTKVSIDEDTRPGTFLIDWYRVCKKQMAAMDKELLACVG